MTLLRAITTVGGFTAVSRVTGFARDILIAAFLGAGPVADAFFVAFKFPNFFRRLTGEGAFSAAFVPMFARILAGEGQKEAVAFAREALSVLLAALLALLLAAELAMPWLVAVIAPGFLDTPERYDLTVELTRITFPYLPLVSMVALYGGVLNALDRFAAMAASPILLNLVLIGAILGFAGALATPGHALAWGVAAAGVGQLAWMALAARAAGVPLVPGWPRLTERVRRLLKLMVPGAIGAGVLHLNLVIDVLLASFLPTGAVSFLYYADRVNQLPLGVVGVAVGTALLPLMARRLRTGDVAGALAAQNRACEFALLLTVPAAAALIAIPDAVIGGLFQRGAFAEAETRATAAALAAFATGLPAYVLVKVFAPGFFAREDTATPVKVAIAAAVANVAFMLVLMQVLAHVGIALATALASWLNAGVLAFLLRRDGLFAVDGRLRRAAPRILGAALAMAGGLLAADHWLAPRLAGSQEGRAMLLAVLVAIGAALYAALVMALRVARPADLRRLARG